MNHLNLLLIGFGSHAKRIYYKIAQRDGNKFGFRIAAAVDLAFKKPEIESFLDGEQDNTIKMYYTSPQNERHNRLPSSVGKRLHEIVNTHNIHGVIIATDPISHVAYSHWALSEGLSILMDKPVSVRKHISTDPDIPKLLLLDYNSVLKAYIQQKQKNPHLLFSLMAQRRFHPAFHKIKSLISEVQKATNCPVTSVQSFHGDGQWRMPNELANLRYHGYTEGYGKCSHSGYHFFDIVAWLLEAGEGTDKQMDSVEIFVNTVRPADFLTQLSPLDFQKIFPLEKISRIPEKNINNLGEIDAFCSLAFKQKNQTITLGSINLAHNSFSQRGWYSSLHRDLYKGNGRLRHEIHIIEQGPFQAIELISLQSEEVRPDNKTKLYEPGGEFHLDIHVFRNHALFNTWNSYEKYSIADLSNRNLDNRSRGHQEDARRNAVLEFITALRKKKIHPVSDFSDHRRSIILMSGVYQSMANRFAGKNPLIRLPFRKYT